MRGVIPSLARRLGPGRRPALPPRSPIPRSEAAPLGLLLLALASVFAFGGDRGHFHRGELHELLSARTLAISSNLSAEHGFLLFDRLHRLESGELRYVNPYSRFPIGPYALVRIVTLPFGDDFPRETRAARLLMLAFFAASAVLAHLALARLLGDRWIALAATLFAFSSYYLLYFADAISAVTSTNLFGAMLVFHGMVLFAQEGRFRQLLPKTAAAVLLGWFVVGLIAPFVLLGLVRELLRARGGGDRRAAMAAVVRSRPVLRYAGYGAFAVLCCTLVLGFNLANEYRAFGGEIALHELPTVRSALSRAGIDDEPGETTYGLPWTIPLQVLFGGIGGMAIPHAVAWRLGVTLDLQASGSTTGDWPPPSLMPWLALAGAALTLACAAGLRRLPHRMLFATLLLAGPGWAILFRGFFVPHDFAAIFFTGNSLALYALALLGLRRLLGPRRAARALPAAALAAGAVFAISAWDMERLGRDAGELAFLRETSDDFRAMRDFTAGGTVLYSAIKRADVASYKHIRYWLHGQYLRPYEIATEQEWAEAARHDFVILPVDIGGSLTPGNGRFHLYSPAALDAAWDALAAREPDARSSFEVRLDGRAIVWTRDICAQDDVWPPLFVHAVPLDANDLPPGRREAGFEAIEYYLPHYGARFGGRCVASAELPDYPLAGLRTGQRPGSLPPVWEVSFPVGDPSFTRRATSWFGNVTAEEPAARGPFGVYREGRTLTYVLDGCTWENSRDRFFVHAYAADAGDLPAERREAGFETLDFWFRERGVLYGGTCMAQIALPDYEVRSVRTGQYNDYSVGHLWDEEFALDAASWLARFDALAAREPDARGAGFALRLDGRTLTLAREACTAADVADRFFVHAYAADGSREAIDFWFRQRGERHGDRCLASVQLPSHPLARLVAGQYDASGHLWEAVFPVGE